MVLGAEIFLLFAFTVILGYLGVLFYHKTKIPDIIWLITFGLLLGPILHLYDPSPFIKASSLMSVIALCIILFDAGINMDFNIFVKVFPKSLLLTFLYYSSTMLLVGVSLYLFRGDSMNLLSCLLLGAMLNTSTVAVSSILHVIDQFNLNLEDVKNILILESVLSDSIAFITVITIIRLIMSPATSITSSFGDLFVSFIFSIGFGFFSGAFWSFSLNRLSKQKFNYILTMAIAFLVYVFSEELVEGSGALSLLFFGLLLVNSDSIFDKFGLKGYFEVDYKHLREFHEEISFLLKSFFFVYVGLITYISFNQILLGLCVSAIVLFTRIITVKIYGFIVKLNNVEVNVIRYTIANGLPALVMSRLPSIYDPNKLFFTNPELYTNICFVVVFVTVLLGAFITPYMVSRSVKNVQLTTDTT